MTVAEFREHLLCLWNAAKRAAENPMETSAADTYPHFSPVSDQVELAGTTDLTMLLYLQSTTDMGDFEQQAIDDDADNKPMSFLLQHAWFNRQEGDRR